MKIGRLGIYGGTFNPPHLGHRRAAEAFLKEASLDKLLIMPTAIPPHKLDEKIISASDRVCMSNLAFSDLEKTEISDFEVKNGGRSYTYLTLSEFKKHCDELFFLVGTDMFLTLDLWKNPEIIFSLATVVLIRRENDPEILPEILKKSKEYQDVFSAKIMFLNARAFEVSSTEIRDMILSGKDTSELLSESVRAYAYEKGIYSGDFTDSEIENLSLLIGQRLSAERFLHTVGVAKAAEKIAEHCLPEKRNAIRAAAYLHDIAKELTDDELLEIINADSSLSDEDKASKKLHHAFAAPEVIKRDFGRFATDEVLSAVFNHTTGASGMSLFDEIIFVADYVESGRKYPECIAARDELFSKLNPDSRKESVSALHKCALAEINNTIGHLLKKGFNVNQRTSETKKYIEQKIKESR